MKLSELPKGLRPFAFHGVDLRWKEGDGEAHADCPFCDAPKFSIDPKTTKWGCFRCKKGGNAIKFLWHLWETADKSTTDYKELTNDRGLLFADTLMHWEVAWSPIRREWVMVSRNSQNRNISNLYRYVEIEGKKRLLATPTFGHGVFGLDTYSNQCRTVYLCEGPWDAMALWEMLKTTKATEKGYQVTGNVDKSLLSDASVLAVPGCNVFNADWFNLFADRDVIILYDSDHPKKNPKTGTVIEPVGFAGVRRVGTLLQESPRPPASVSYLRWGEKGYDPSLPDNFDLRDALEGPPAARRTALHWVGERIAPLPRTGERDAEGASKEPSSGMLPKPCSDYRVLTTSWRKALKWGDGLDHALASMLASVASVKTVGDQLWLKVISPPSTGKTLLCEAVSTNRKYVVPISTFRGFHSGYRGDDNGDKSDPGLISQLYDMTMVMKDGDTLLTTPNLTQVLSEGRDLYDGASRSHYRNKTGKAHENIRMTWILCGTAALRELDSSELGERFLDVVIMDKIDPIFEDAILVRAAHRAAKAANISTDGATSSKYDDDITEAMRLTGGYVDWLKEYGPEKVPKIEIGDEALHRCLALGKFVAYMRARPSTRQVETAEREMAARLVSQLVRYAKFVALVTNRDSVDESVLKRVQKVALDTARGVVLNLCFDLLEREEGILPESAALLINETAPNTMILLRFMRQIRILETYTKIQEDGSQGKIRWRLTGEVRGVLERVLEGSDLITE